MQTPHLRDRRITKSIGVRTDAKDRSNFNLRFSVEVRAPIIFKPNPRLAIATVEGQEARKRILMRRADGGNLEILSTEADDQRLVVVTEQVNKKERTSEFEAAPGDVWLEIILPADAAIGSRTGKLRLSTNDPVAKVFEVPFAIRVRPLIEHRPKGLRLWPTPSRTGDGYSGFVVLNRNGGGFFTITKIDVSHPDIFSASVVASEPANRQTVRVELAEGLGPEAISGTIEGWIEISTDDTVRAQVQVPVIIASNREGSRRPFHTRRSE